VPHPFRLPARILTVLAALVCAASCGGSDAPYGPPVGAPCSTNAQCPTGHCCKEKYCGGVCTYRCGKDIDCPAGMGCEHGVCLFACRGDLDCAPGEKCKGSGVCEKA
jgi:hypothetical protein